uniref:VTT domain-containing protein n=1 Tax=Arcella intermedia TaxID=1963864 RepID=A0A6B2LHN3_9EUKA
MTSMGCGFLYPWHIAFLTVSTGVLLGLTSAFFILRFYCKDKILDLLGNGKKLQAIIQAVNQEPIKFGLLMRAIPVTSGLQTSILCLTNIKFSTFLWTSLVGDLSQHSLYIYLGTQLGDLTKMLSGDSSMSSSQMYFMIIQISVAVAVIGFVLNKGRKIFQKIDQNDIELQLQEEEERGKKKSST